MLELQESVDGALSNALQVPGLWARRCDFVSVRRHIPRRGAAGGVAVWWKSPKVTSGNFGSRGFATLPPVSLYNMMLFWAGTDIDDFCTESFF